MLPPHIHPGPSETRFTLTLQCIAPFISRRLDSSREQSSFAFYLCRVLIQGETREDKTQKRQNTSKLDRELLVVGFKRLGTGIRDGEGFKFCC